MHHPRRLVQPEFMESLYRVLVAGGEVLLKTDDLPYFQWMERVCRDYPKFRRIEWEQPQDWPKTDFEMEYLEKGLPIHHLRLRKV
jgi:tRNA (guanine-N7-)-methyltransferase